MYRPAAGWIAPGYAAAVPGRRAMFTEKERAYLSSQRLARLATVSPSGQPDADVVGFELDGDDILIGSYQNLAGSRKYERGGGRPQGFPHRRQPRFRRSHGPSCGED